jgi:hypothetical protein
MKEAVMKQFAAPLLALAATSLSLGAAANAATGLAAGPSQMLHANPDSSIAWILALGFLGLVVLRRTRSGPIH